MSAIAAKSQRTSLAKMRTRRERWGWFFTAPFTIVFTLFLLAPLGYSFYMSLYKKGMVGGARFAGAQNYVRAFTDPIFLHGLLRVLLFVVVMVPIQIVLASLVAMVLDVLTTKLARVSRLLVFLPYAVPAMIGALMWSFLYSPSFGPIKQLFSAMGLSAPNVLSPNNVFGALVNVVTWQWVGYYMIIIFAALKAVDPSLYEAALIDGASSFQTAVRIKLPLIAPSLVMCTVFSLIGTLQFYTEPVTLRAAAPSAIPVTYTPNMYAQNLAFSQGLFNYSATISFSLGIIVFIGSYAFLFATRKQSGLK